MRLTHIKLAGFKSFVDPTHVAFPGQLIGVVGPNGCGKSNVIDAVRWVLGESSARHLRGETMQDVIFNGSGERKPANRASVELVFDNSLGKATGPFAQYGEISIKRVLERDGESTYYINNMVVRRRDVADLFLGTGLGARAYAIIEQGMISRVVEAKPEELRIFLEEAAGVSKYRERRKETEARLDDTQENLLRVEDIRRELESQITHLEAQAVAAEKYRELETQSRRNQHLLWIVRKQDAASQRTRVQRDVDQANVDLEQAAAALRDAEKRLETLRVEHYSASDTVHAAQGALYECNAELARVEQELSFLRSNRQRAEARLNALQSQISEHTERETELSEALTQTRAELESAMTEAGNRKTQLQSLQAKLPEMEQRYRTARGESERAQQALAEGRRQREIAVTQRDHGEKVLSQLATRRARLEEESAALEMPDERELSALQADGRSLDQQIADAKAALAEADRRVPELDEAQKKAAQVVEAERQRFAALEARRQALVGLQQQVGASEQMAAWLGQRGLAKQQRLWEGVRVTSGWEDALEAVLRERLNAIAVNDPNALDDWFGASPPGKLAVYRADSANVNVQTPALDGCNRMIDLVSSNDAAISGVLREWLQDVYAVDSVQAALRIADGLTPHGIVVSREGHVFTRHSVGFHAPDSEIHGLLERKREIESLEAELPQHQAQLNEARNALTAAETELREQRAEQERTRNALAELNEKRHEVELQEVRGSQTLERTRHRQAQIEQELAEIATEEAREQQLMAQVAQSATTLDSQFAGLQSSVDHSAGAYAQIDQALAAIRQELTNAERQAQEAAFAERSYVARIGELENTLANLAEQIERGRDELSGAQADVASFDEAPITVRLDTALKLRAEREAALAQCRDALAEAERTLKATEQERMEAEQKLEPLRARIGELKLKEQEARLAEENFAQQLLEAEVDEAQLLQGVEKLPRPGALQGEINRLNEEINAIGPVNLAALEEVKSSKERKGFLDAQSADLNEAIATLQEAIRRIDRETRERLQATFDEVNKNLSEMFPTLFGGGEARLVMTGEEILDSGVQIVARPPGKKNSSIHLLSGGEKALTAVSLVFSLFKLNPAPFCMLDEVDAPLDDTNTGRFCDLVKRMAEHTQFVFISHNKITMEIAEQLIGVTMPELGVSRVVAVDIEEAMKMREERAA